jgi:predicted ABC-type ATPase
MKNNKKKNTMAKTYSYNYAYDKIKDKLPVKPLFIIKYGPPASGKNTVMLLCSYFPTLQDESTINADLDYIISEMPEYKEDPGTRQEAYQRWKPLGMEIMDDLIRQATLLPCHITFETTGYSIAWTIPLIKQMISVGYRIVLMYPLVQLPKLIERIRIREETTGQVAAPINSTQVNGNTIPGITEMNQRAIQNLKHLIPFLDELFLIDNNEESARVIMHIRNVTGSDDPKSKYIPGTIKRVQCTGGKYKHEWYDQYIKDLLQKHCTSST